MAKASNFNVKVTTFALALLVLASARTLLQQGDRASACDSGSGRWDDNDMSCDFRCDGKSYELDCETSNSGVGCKLDGNGQADSEDIYFRCKITSSDQVSIL
jgi:hypothetical protein